MNVLHINQSDVSSGAAIAAYRLHQGLLNLGVESNILASSVRTNDHRVAQVPRNNLIGKILYVLTQPLSLNYIHNVGSFDISKHDFYQKADVINFHNLHTGHFNYLALPTLTKHKPAVFTLHDMWGFTGHCAYSYDCNRWQIGCGQCLYPESYPPVKRDNTKIEWQIKKWIYHNANLTIVTPSKWLMEQAEKSILNKSPIYHIPHGIDTNIYQPLNPEKCRNLLGIPSHKKVLMFGADYLNDSRKGGDLLKKSLASLSPMLKAEIVLLTIGNCSESFSETLGMISVNLDYVGGDRLKAIAYSAADLFAFPTRADNFPLMLQESLSCGTPMVSFNIGGVPDLVRHGVTGYLASPENTDDFCQGIIQLLADQNLRHEMSENCRSIALEEYSLQLQSKRYLDLYRKILNG